MTSVSALVQMMKEGIITKDKMIYLISETEITPVKISENIKTSPTTPFKE